MFNAEKKEFKVGDVIVVKNWAATYRYEVTRVTKTQAICDIRRKNGTGYTAKFRKEYSKYDNGAFHITPIPRIEWNTNEYTVISED